MTKSYKKLNTIFTIVFLLSFNKIFSDCTGCGVTVSNSTPSYTVASGKVVCVPAGLTYTGTIVLSGGTLCNSGTVQNITFLSGTFSNYGTYKVSKLTTKITGNVTVDNYNAAIISIGPFDLSAASSTYIFQLNIYKGSIAGLTSITQNSGNFMIEVGKSNPGSDPVSTSTLNVTGLFTSKQDAFNLLVQVNASVNISDILSLEGIGVKSVTNYGSMVLSRDLNMISAGSSASTVTINNYNSFQVQSVNASYTAGKVFINNYAGSSNLMSIGASLTLSNNTNTLTNTGNIAVVSNFNIQNGLAINTGTITNNLVSVSGGTLSNYNYLKSTTNFSITNTLSTANNNGMLDIAGQLSNIGTLNLGAKTYINTKDYYNDDNATINGPASIPDSLSYAKIYISGSSQNNGYMNGKVLVYTTTITPTTGNNGYGFNTVVNGSRIANTVAYASTSLGPGQPIAINCYFLQQLYSVSAAASSASICAGASVNLTSQFYQKITFTIGPFPPFIPSAITFTFNVPFTIPNANYSWMPGSLVGQNQTVNPIATTVYTVTAGFLCNYTSTIAVNVFPSALTINPSLSGILCFPATGLILNTALIYNAPITYQWYLNGSPISGANSFSYAPTQVGAYNLQISNGICTSVTSNSINLFPTPAVTITASPAGVCQGNPVNFTATIGSNSGSGFSYQWTQNSTNVGTNSNLYSTVLAGSYAVNVTNSNGCIGASNSLNIQVSINLTANAGPDQIYNSTPVPIGGNPACATNGVPPYSSVWSTSSGFVTGTINQCNNTVAPSTTTIYTVTVTDLTGCQSTDNVMVTRLSNILTYIVPKKVVDGGYQLPVLNKVYFKFEEEYKTSTLAYKIYDYNSVTANIQPANVACSLTPAAKNLGDNRYYIDIGTCSLQTTKFYLVEITNDKNEKFYFKFLN